MENVLTLFVYPEGQANYDGYDVARKLSENPLINPADYVWAEVCDSPYGNCLIIAWLATEYPICKRDFFTPSRIENAHIEFYLRATNDMTADFSLDRAVEVAIENCEVDDSNSEVYRRFEESQQRQCEAVADEWLTALHGKEIPVNA